MKNTVYFVIGTRNHQFGTSTKMSGIFDDKKKAEECAFFEFTTHDKKEWYFDVYKTKLNKTIEDRPESIKCFIS